MPKKKNRDLQWNVYYENINARKIQIFNVFDHGRFKKETEENLDRSATKEEFSKKMRTTTMYYYWSKAEWEIVLCPWVPHIDKKEFERLSEEYEKESQKRGETPKILYVNPLHGEKIDVFEQLNLNWEIFIDYIWNKK